MHRRKTQAEKFEDEQASCTTWSVDYTYFTREGLPIPHNDDAQIESHKRSHTLGRPVLASYDRKTKTGQLHDAEQKGPEDRWILARTIKDIDETG